MTRTHTVSQTSKVDLHQLIRTIVREEIEETPTQVHRYVPTVYARDRIVLDRHTPLGLTQLGCEEHQGAHRSIAVKKLGGDVEIYCSVLVFLEFHRKRIESGHFSEYKHFMFPDGFPASPRKLEDALT